jgi:hypothetical protein
MGFMDKAREAAQQATTKAQQGLAQGQAKLDDAQTSRAADGLLRDLGSAFYAEQRSGGSREAVLAALGALDAHVAAHGPLGQTGHAKQTAEAAQGSTEAKPQQGPPAGTPSGTPPAEPSAGPPAAPSAGPAKQPPADPPAAGGYTLDDL